MLHDTVTFGLGLEPGVDQIDDMLRHAKMADAAGLDMVCIGDHPLFAHWVDAYAALGYVLGSTERVTGMVMVTNLMSRPAPILARTIAGMSALSGGRVATSLGAGGSWEEIVALGVPQLSGGDRIRSLDEAIRLIRLLTGGGDPVTFDGDFYQVRELAPSAAPTPPIWVGVGGPKGLAVVGREADGWIPPHAADWRSSIVAEGRPRIDEAALAAGREPLEVGTLYIVAGQITETPLAQTRNDTGRWVGGSVDQWVDELTYAALECGASGFNYLARPGEVISDATIGRWASEITPAVREAIARG